MPQVLAGNGEVSADPARLQDFVQASRTQDMFLHEELSRLRSAWTRFTSTCSWVPVDNGTFIAGFEQHLNENHADSNWIDEIASEFSSIAEGTCKWLDDKFNITPHDSMPTGWAWGTWGVGNTVTALGMGEVLREQKLTRRAPRVGWLPKWIRNIGKRFPSTQNFLSRVTDFHVWDTKKHGQFAKITTIPTSKRGQFFYNLGQNRVPKPFKAEAVTKWGKFGSALSIVGGVVTGGVAGYDQWQQDSNDSNMRTADKAGRAGFVGLTVGASAMGGAALGATLGSAIPGVGTVVGGIAGGIIGGVAGSAVGQKIGDTFKGVVGRGTQQLADTTRDVGKGIADAGKAVGDFFNGVFGER